MIFRIFIAIWIFLVISGCGSISGSKASLQITSNPQAKIFINDTEFGQTPFFSDQLSANQIYRIRLQSNSGSFTQELELLPNTLSIINRQLSVEDQKSEGETVSLVKGTNGLHILSFPTGSHVFVDGEFKGNTPLNIDNLSLGDHRVTLKKEGFIDRSVRIHIQKDYSVVVSSQLSIEDRPNTVDPLPKVLIKNSPTGFLRVRTDPDINSQELTRVAPGQVFEVLELNNNFARIKIDELTSGWVSSEYIQNL